MAFPTRVSEVIKVVFLVILGLAFVSNCEVVIDVTAAPYSAAPDGKTESGLKFTQAWTDACKATEPSRLLVPAGDFLTGEVVFQGPCTTQVTVDIQGTMLSNTDVTLYTRNTWIMVENVEGVVITGTGTLNGQGEAAWKLNSAQANGDPESILPISLCLEEVKNVVVQNINLLNSKGFHMKVFMSHDITVTNVKITAPEESPNTDGCHISQSTNVTISNCNIGTGDDCVSIGDTNTDITVDKVTCGPGHGISVGSLGKRVGEGDVKGIKVTNCTLTGTTNGARIKSYQASPALAASGITFEDIVMENVQNPIIIDQFYHSKASNEPSQVKISDVHFRNIRGSTSTANAVSVACSTAVPCEGVELDNIVFTPAPGLKGTIGSVCTNAQLVIAAGAQIPPGCK